MRIVVSARQGELNLGNLARKSHVAPPLAETPRHKPLVKRVDPTTKVASVAPAPPPITIPKTEQTAPMEPRHTFDQVEPMTALTKTSVASPLLEKVEAEQLPSAPVLEAAILVATDIEPLPAAAEAGIETTFEPEVMQSFEALLALVQPVEESPPTEQIVTYEDFVQGRVILLQPEAEPVIQTTQFEIYMIQQPPPENPPDIETIVLSANQQPLEVTLVQLGQYLAESSVLPSEHTEIRRTITEVIALLSQTRPDHTASDEMNPVITPELTQKLLLLLGSVGYDHPHEMLRNFTTQHSLEFLLQAIVYLGQLLDAGNRQEFASTVFRNVTVFQADQPLIIRLGQTLVRHCSAYKVSESLRS